ncbi:MAG: cell division protein FtsZ [Candidatus Thermoplasmatota archaeon]|jgi:cell division protein FtsZ|nr:cell division protein FtsZ [Candidatus Thermoplasmatota archaeon]
MSDILDVLYRSAMENSVERGNDQANQSDFSAPEDLEILEVARNLGVSIKIIGCGGGGSNTVSRIHSEGLEGARLIAINTDANHLYTVGSEKKILIGAKRTRGLGTGAIPQIGEEAANEDLTRIQKLVQKTDIAFITCGLGGGTGTGAAPIVAKCAKNAGALVISIVTLPFTAEGHIRMDNALSGLEKLSKYSDTVIAIPNDKLLKEVPKKPIQEAFQYADKVLSAAMKGITELITDTGLINLDYADIKAIMKDGGTAMIGIGEASGGTNRVLAALNDAISSPLVEADISDAKNCLIRVVGGPSMTVGEAEAAMKEIQEKIDPDARIIWGANVDEKMGERIRVLVLLTGVKSPYMMSGEDETQKIRQLLAGNEGVPDIDIIR